MRGAKVTLRSGYAPISFPGSAEVVGVIETYKDVTELVVGIRRPSA